MSNLCFKCTAHAVFYYESAKSFLCECHFMEENNERSKVRKGCSDETPSAETVEKNEVNEKRKVQKDLIETCTY